MTLRIQRSDEARMGRFHARRSNPSGPDLGAAELYEVGNAGSWRVVLDLKEGERLVDRDVVQVPGPELERGSQAEKLLFIHL